MAENETRVDLGEGVEAVIGADGFHPDLIGLRFERDGVVLLGHGMTPLQAEDLADALQDEREERRHA